MSKEFLVQGDSKQAKYESLCFQLEAMVSAENDMIANMANIVAALRETFNFFWVGFYRVFDDQLLLGPFQGPIACTRIEYGKGVCGTAWKEERVMIVPDVDQFPGHIACSSLSRSEIVVPVWSGDKVIAVLDVDSDQLNAFDSFDSRYLVKICNLLATSSF